MEIKYLSIITIVFIVTIREIAKSYRINQFKNIDDSKIKAIGDYEKKAKQDYSSFWKRNRNND